MRSSIFSALQVLSLTVTLTFCDQIFAFASCACLLSRCFCTFYLVILLLSSCSPIFLHSIAFPVIFSDGGFLMFLLFLLHCILSDLSSLINFDFFFSFFFFRLIHFSLPLAFSQCVCFPTSYTLLLISISVSLPLYTSFYLFWFFNAL